ncbi:MAG: hypothetical protein HC796_04550 [Synechococcaceae cyanobacterium RL_1_2]|nr:hypothetical protein [Synechococcaceae cyanobacterium RL_1_2]
MKEVLSCPICSTDMKNNPNKCPTCGWHDLSFLVKQFQPDDQIPQGIARINRHREDWACRAWFKLLQIYKELNDLKANRESLEQEIAALNAENLGIREQIERYRLSEMEISTDTMDDYDSEDYAPEYPAAMALSLPELEMVIAEKFQQFRDNLVAELPQEIGLNGLQDKLERLEGKLLSLTEANPSIPSPQLWQDHTPEEEEEFPGIVISEDYSDQSSDFTHIQASDYSPPGGNLDFDPVMGVSDRDNDDFSEEDLGFDDASPDGDENELGSSDFGQPEEAAPASPELDDRYYALNFKETYIPQQNIASTTTQFTPETSIPKRNPSNVVNQLTFQETELVTLYNQGDKSFEAIEIALTTDSQLRRREGYDEPPVFEAQKRGDFWLVNFRHELYLVPKLKLKVNSYNLSTIRSLFNCYGVNDKSPNFRLLKPARLKNMGNEQWQLDQMGILQFQ